MKTASRKLHRRFKNRTSTSTRAGGRQSVTAARRACTIGLANCVENYDSIYETASDPGYIDEPVIRVEPAASETLYYHRNHQYSVTALTSSTGAVVERYEYTAYGEPKFLSVTGTVLSDSAKDNRYTYTGREWDKTIRLYHFRERMYDSESGRFCGRDPLSYVDGRNQYRVYLRLDAVDPTGFACQSADPEEPKGPCGHEKVDPALIPTVEFCKTMFNVTAIPIKDPVKLCEFYKKFRGGSRNPLAKLCKEAKGYGGDNLIEFVCCSGLTKAPAAPCLKKLYDDGPVPDGRDVRKRPG